MYISVTYYERGGNAKRENGNRKFKLCRQVKGRKFE